MIVVSDRKKKNKYIYSFSLFIYLFPFGFSVLLCYQPSQLRRNKMALPYLGGDPKNAGNIRAVVPGIQPDSDNHPVCVNIIISDNCFLDGFESA